MRTDTAARIRREGLARHRDPAHMREAHGAHRDPAHLDSAHRDLGHRDAILRLVSDDTPVVIFEVDTAGVDDAAAPARRCDIRLVGARDRQADRAQRAPDDRPADGERRGPGDRELAAVLVLRSLTPARLRSCVRAMTDGGHAVPPELLCSMLPDRGPDGREVKERLTERELDVLRLLGDGETTKEIALRLSYSERTVKAIVHDVLDKLGCKTRAHAVAMAARTGVI